VVVYLYNINLLADIIPKIIYEIKYYFPFYNILNFRYYILLKHYISLISNNLYTVGTFQIASPLYYTFLPLFSSKQQNYVVFNSILYSGRKGTKIQVRWLGGGKSG